MSRREGYGSLENIMGICISLLGAGSFLGGAGVLAYQIIDWLKTGEWFPVPVWKIFELMGSDLSFIPEIEWRGLQKILLWLLDLPLSIALPVSGILLALGVGWFVWPFVQSLRPPPEGAERD